MGSIVGGLLAIILIFGGTFLLTANLAENDCQTRTTHSPWNYHYEFPFTCIYVGTK